MKASGKAHLALLTANIIYGINYSMAKIALPEYVKPLGFIFIRVSIAMILFWILHIFFVREKIKIKDIPLLFICGIFGVAINQLFFFKGLAITTEINASLIMITTPILVLLMSHFIIKEKITISKIIGITAGAAGAFLLIAFGKSFTFGSETSLGDFFILVNAASYALYLVLVKPLMKKYHPLTVIKWVFLFGFTVAGVAGYNEFQDIEWQTFTWKVWVSIGYVVIATTFIAYLLNIFALSKVNPSLVSIYIYSQPLIASIVAISIGNDTLTPVKTIAAVLIFAGVYLVSNYRLKKNTFDE